jgi:hypothetical protein
MVIGCKLLQRDGTSLNGKYRYNLDGEWNIVPGNGAYVAVTGGLTLAGEGPKLVYLECREPTRVVAPNGVRCFRHVRVIPACPERLTRELRGEIAFRYASGLTAEQRVTLARESTPEWRGQVACYASGFTPEQRVELALAQGSTPELRGEIACYAPGLTPEQRVALAIGSTPEWRGEIARYASGLTAEQRVTLARESTPEWRGTVACYAPRLTAEQRVTLARESTPEWRRVLLLEQ